MESAAEESVAAFFGYEVTNGEIKADDLKGDSAEKVAQDIETGVTDGI